MKLLQNTQIDEIITTKHFVDITHQILNSAAN